MGIPLDCHELKFPKQGPALDRALYTCFRLKRVRLERAPGYNEHFFLRKALLIDIIAMFKEVQLQRVQDLKPRIHGPPTSLFLYRTKMDSMQSCGVVYT